MGNVKLSLYFSLCLILCLILSFGLFFSCGSKLKYELQKEQVRTFSDGSVPMVVQTPVVEVTPIVETTSPSSPSAPSSPSTNEKFIFTQSFIDSTGAEVTITNKDDGLPVVMIFAQETCSSCSHEVSEILASLKHPDSNPSKIHLFTILVGAVAEDAQNWKQSKEVPWRVGIDEDASIMRNYCPLDTVPCIVVHTSTKGIVLRHHGIYSIFDLKKLTGEWEVL
ncbi:MAG: hypothetical protein HQK49_08005 [Oligoflexia bacterium]|nr:hypothetical protein [Oligoflexia bacterium]